MRSPIGFSCSVVVLVGWLAAMPARADLVFYADRASFNAANPGLPVEDFEEARLNPGQGKYLDTPLSSTTNDAVFHPGDILPGVTFRNYFLPTTEPIIALGAGAITGTSKLIGNGVADDALSIAFGGDVTAAALDLYAARGNGDSMATKETITIFTYNGSANDTITHHDVSLAAVAGGFFGVRSDARITGIRVDTSDNYVELADNVAFGRPQSVPEPASVLLIGVGAAGLLARARSRAGHPRRGS